MSILGVVLAGGRSSRFGSDKAMALLNGRPLIEHALSNLRRHADEVAIVGRHVKNIISIADLPAPGLGPLGGLCGALGYAARHGYDSVLTCSVDCPWLPDQLFRNSPSYLKAQPVIGRWPVSAASALQSFIATDTRRSVRGFAEHIAAEAVDVDFVPLNINTPEDLAAAALYSKD